MYPEQQIARAKYAELQAQFDNVKVVEGTTVEVPNLFDRAILALGNALVSAGHALVNVAGQSHSRTVTA